MRLAQVEIYKTIHGHPPILLFDDLPSELDRKAQDFVFNYLISHGVQVFLTSVEDVSDKIHKVAERFHVEQGKIQKVL